ncbi:hypothetical protein [Bacillus mycoides]|uniref:hypothetical protein n=1 Tax=Bacillus mycoides TaxID=1405 RepID=UPI00159654F7|nr:hypothetical protein [Bacillus mycoides]
MKKILSTLSVLAVLGVFLLNSSDVVKEQPKQAAITEPTQYKMMVDPGGGGAG